MAQEQVFPVTTAASLSPKLIQIQHQWPIIARDLVLLDTMQMGTTYDMSDIAAAYGITIQDLRALIEIPAFQSCIEAEKKRFEALGPQAGIMFRAEAMALDLQEVLYLRAKQGEVDEKTIMSFLQYLSKISGLEPAKENNNINQNAINITVNVPKLDNPKLAHLYPVEDVEYAD